MGLNLSRDPAADALLTNDPLALLIGMVLDQQIPLERAFAAPYELTKRLGRSLDAHAIADADPDELAAAFSRQPALHRFPGSMARRVQQLARLIVEKYDGDAENVWRTAADGRELFRRIAELPGFGVQKAKIFVALLGKQCDVTPPGWRAAAGPFGEEGVFRSVADITDQTTRDKVRDYKKQLKMAAKTLPS
jgi:uncharacterized HhH-GPD family protein